MIDNDPNMTCAVCGAVIREDLEDFACDRFGQAYCVEHKDMLPEEDRI